MRPSGSTHQTDLHALAFSFGSCLPALGSDFTALAADGGDLVEVQMFSSLQPQRLHACHHRQPRKDAAKAERRGWNSFLMPNIWAKDVP